MPTYSISGTIGPIANGPGTTVSLTGTSTASTTADSSGNFTFAGLANGSYTVTPSKAGFTFSPTSSPASISNANVTAVNFTATANTTGQTLFTSQTPSSVNLSDGSSANYELGTAFTSSVAGQITAIRFWKDSKESGTHTGRIWSNTGTMLASVAFANETASGWQQQALPAALSISANTQYVVTVNTGNTYYVATDSGLASKIVSGNLSTVVGSNGLYGSVGSFPTNSWMNSNYFRDIVFVSGSGVSGTTYSISGSITPAASGNGATITLSGAANATTTVNSSGTFTFSGVTNGAYTLTPSKAGFTFSPGSQPATVNGSSITVGAFTATASPTYSISGNTGTGAGVTVNLSGPSTASTTTDGSGNYSFSALANGSTYVISPTNSAYVFTPSNQSVTLNGANVTGVNFTASAAPSGFSISGKITLSSKGLGAGSTLTLANASSGVVVASTTADSSGNFTLTGIANGSYVLTPTSSAAAFTPVSRNITISGANSAAANFTAAGLIFYDDFTGSSLGSEWTVISRHGEYAQGETECNIPQMVSVANSILTIKTVAQATTCGDFNTDGTVRHAPTSWPYATGAIQWTNLNFTYGTVEIRAQFPAKSTQVWPATWMLGTNCQLTNIYTADTGYSSCPNFGASGYRELDLTECFGSTWCQFNAYNPGDACQSSYSVDNNYHIFTTVWTASSVTQAVDGVTVSTCNLSMNQPLFLIIQTQTGGVGGTPANLPTTLNVDYVKVTQP